MAHPLNTYIEVAPLEYVPGGWNGLRKAVVESVETTGKPVLSCGMADRWAIRTKNAPNAGQESYQKGCHPWQRILAKSVVTLYITTGKNESRPLIRLQVEVDLRDLKTTLGMEILKGHKVQTVIKEVLVFALVYNLVRLVMLKAAHQQKVSPLRISFIDALRWLQPPKPVQSLPDLVVNPVRPDRIEPRCIKRRMKEYDLMTTPRRELRKRLKKRRDAA